MNPSERHVDTALFDFLRNRCPEFKVKRAKNLAAGSCGYYRRKDIVLLRDDGSNRIFMSARTAMSADSQRNPPAIPNVEIVLHLELARAVFRERRFAVSCGANFKQSLSDALEQVYSSVLLEKI